MSEQGHGVVARQTPLSDIFQLRWDVLRPNRPIEAAQFPGDQAPETIHVGAFTTDGQNVGCATATLTTWQERPAWQLRGMGVAPDWQRKGVGQLVLAEIERLVRQASDIRQVWCNARAEAVAFYEKLGWAIASERFHIEDVGPHYKMTKTL